MKTFTFTTTDGKSIELEVNFCSELVKQAIERRDWELLLFLLKK